MTSPIQHPVESPSRDRSRADLARSRSLQAWAELGRCRLCAHECGANRFAGETGPCRAGTVSRVFHAQTEVGDERELAPLFAVSFSGCDLRCDFCNTGRESWDPSAGTVVCEGPQVSPGMEAVARRAVQALERGARGVMILGGEPTVHLPAALQLASLLPPETRLIWKTNAHGTAVARELLAGVFDTWVADLKFGQDACALRLARIPEYTRIVRENLRWAHQHTDLIVRHLLMPGHLDCCWRPAAEWLAAELPGVRVSLRAGFWPGWFSSRHAELRSTTTAAEESRARELGLQLGLQLVP